MKLETELILLQEIEAMERNRQIRALLLKEERKELERRFCIVKNRFEKTKEWADYCAENGLEPNYKFEHIS